MTPARARFFFSMFGLSMALVAVMLGDRRITWLAIAILMIAFGLRFVGRPAKGPPPS